VSCVASVVSGQGWGIFYNVRMIRKITLQNFMAHKLTVIEPAEGLTVLAGPNNCGKSAVVEALQVVAGNTGKDFMVRHGETDCRIAVETSEGDEIVWRRKGAGGGVTSYAVNGREIHRVRGSVPEEVAEKLRLREVEGPEGKKKFAVHFGLQKEPIFLLDESGGNTATFFASFSDASRLMAMQQLHKRKVMDARAEERALVARDGELTTRLESLLPVAELQAGLGKVEESYAALLAGMSELADLEKRMEGLAGRAAEVASWRQRQKVLENLQTVPALEEVRELEILATRLRDAEGRRQTEEARLRVTAALGVPPELEAVAQLERQCAEMRRHGREAERSSVRALRAIPEVPAMEDVASLEEAIARLKGADALMRARREEWATAEKELGAVVKGIERWVGEHPLCPICGAEMSAERLMGAAGGGGGHAHG
jgi:hypothetical protein